MKVFSKFAIKITDKNGCTSHSDIYGSSLICNIFISCQNLLKYRFPISLTINNFFCFRLTVELPADVKFGDSEKNIIASKDRGGHVV